MEQSTRNQNFFALVHLLQDSSHKRLSRSQAAARGVVKNLNSSESGKTAAGRIPANDGQINRRFSCPTKK